MKRILMVSTHGYFEGKPSFGRADTGGQVVFVIELSKALAKFGYKVDILTRKFEDFEQIEQLNEDVRIVRIPCGGSSFITKEYLVEYLPELVDGFVTVVVVRHVQSVPQWRQRPSGCAAGPPHGTVPDAPPGH